MFQEQDGKGEGAATDTTTSADSEDPDPCSYHLYHGLITYPLKEIRLPTSQVGDAVDGCVRNVTEILRQDVLPRIPSSTYREQHLLRCCISSTAVRCINSTAWHEHAVRAAAEYREIVEAKLLPAFMVEVCFRSIESECTHAQA